LRKVYVATKAVDASASQTVDYTFTIPSGFFSGMPKAAFCSIGDFDGAGTTYTANDGWSCNVRSINSATSVMVQGRNDYQTGPTNLGIMLIAFGPGD
jgi:hypothetical protein